MVWSEWASFLLCVQAECGLAVITFCVIYPELWVSGCSCSLARCSRIFQHQTPGDGGCTNSVTPTAFFSFPLACVCIWVCVCVCVCVCKQQLCEQLSIVTCFICAHTQRWAQTAPLKSVSKLWEPAAFLWPSWELFRETLLYKWLPEKKKKIKCIWCRQYSSLKGVK